MIVITGHFSDSAKFRGNVEIPQQRANSAAELEIPRHVENCVGPNNGGVCENFFYSCITRTPTSDDHFKAKTVHIIIKTLQ